MHKVIQNFLDVIKESKTKRTYLVYYRILSLFDDFLSKRGLSFEKVQLSSISIFVNSNKKWSYTTRKLALITIKQLIKYYRTECIDKSRGMEYTFNEKDRCDSILSAKPKSIISQSEEIKSTIFKDKALSIEQVKIIIQESKTHKLNHSLIVLLLYFGIRKQELMAIRQDDIDFKNGIINIRGTKTPDSKRRLCFNSYVADQLKIFIISKNSIKYDYINSILRKYGRLIERPITSHTMRHTFNTQMLKLYPEIMVKRLMGHAPGGNMSSTYNTITIEDIRKIMIEGHYLKGLIE